jgi:predicted nuclease of predicted toxin-antitoxin system
MKFIVDECTGPRVANWLTTVGYDVLSISPDKKGISDKEILKIAVGEIRILITNDKDFGELIFKQKLSHCGVIFLRLSDETAKNTSISKMNKICQQKHSGTKKNYRLHHYQPHPPEYGNRPEASSYQTNYRLRLPKHPRPFPVVQPMHHHLKGDQTYHRVSTKA